jgi:hypothetical protein
MKTSESLDKIAPALVAAQKAMTFAKKDTTNPHFKSTFAGLPSVIDAVKGPLNENGIAFIQTPSPSEDGKLHLTTRLIHTSGQWIEDIAVCPLPKADPQGFGSASTYLRRYSLAAITGLYQDDDDGEGAKPTAKPADTKTSHSQPPAGTPAGALGRITERTLKDIDLLRSTEEGEKAVTSMLTEWKLEDFSPCTEGEGQEALMWIKKEMKRLAALKK